MYKNKQLALAIALFSAALCGPLHAEIEEVTFTDSVGLNPYSNNPGGPVPVSVSGYFFFDTTQVAYVSPITLSADVQTVPGVWGRGSVDVEFAMGESGFETVTYADGSKVTIPYAGVFGFTGGMFEQCDSLGECSGWTPGRQLTLAQFNAASDPWALIVTGMTGGIDTESYFSLPAEAPGSGLWSVSGGGGFEVEAAAVPEPAMPALLALGLAMLASTRWRALRSARSPR